MYLGMVGATAKQKKKRLAGGGGGGGSNPFTIATSASGNYNNAMTGGIANMNQTNPNSSLHGQYAATIDGSTSTYGTASSPTRTTQITSVEVSDIQDSHNAASQFEFPIFIGGYVRQGDMGTVSNIHWKPDTFGASLSNGVTLASVEVSDSREHTVDNTHSGTNQGLIVSGTFARQGLYSSPVATISQPNPLTFGLAKLRFGGGRGGATFPADGDTIIIRVTLEADAGGSTHTRVHDFTIKFVT